MYEDNGEISTNLSSFEGLTRISKKRSTSCADLLTNAATASLKASSKKKKRGLSIKTVQSVAQAAGRAIY